MPSKKIFPDYFFILFIALSAFLIRFTLWISAKSIWADEWYRIDGAQKALSEIIRIESLTQNHPPTYLVLLSFWIKLFGTSELSYRGLSQILNVLMIFGSYGLAKELFNRKTALLTAAFVGICPYFLHLSNEIRSYSMLAFFATFASYFFFKARNNPDRMLWKAGYVLFAALTIYTEHYGWFWLFGISAYLLYLLIINWKQEKKWVLVQLFVFLISIPSIFLIYYQAHNDEAILAAGAKLVPYRDILDMTKKSFGIFWHFISGPTYSMLSIGRIKELARYSIHFWISFILTCGFLILCFKALIDLFRKQKAVLILSVTIIFFPIFFLLIVYPIRLDARYLCWAVPLLFSLIAYAIIIIKSGYLRKIIIGSFFIYALIADLYIIRIPTDPIHKEDYRGMLKYALEQSGEHDAIVGVGPQTTYYLPIIGIHPKGAYFHDMPEAIKGLESAQFDEVWALLYVDMKPEITDRILREIDAMFSPFNYERKGKLIHFGGPDSLTAMQLYKSKNQLKSLN